MITELDELHNVTHIYYNKNSIIFKKENIADTFLIIASRENCFSVVKNIIDSNNKINPEIHNNQAIYIAYKKKYTKIVKLLFNHEKVRRTLKDDHITIYNDLKKYIILDKIINF
jgi:hypothetical protein